MSNSRLSFPTIVELPFSRIYRLDDSGLQQISEDHHDGSYLTGLLGGSSSELTRAPHCSKIDISPGDQILLCTDGLTDLLSDEEIFLVLMGRSEQPARALVEAAVDAGGRDNVTAVIIRCEAKAAGIAPTFALWDIARLFMFERRLFRSFGALMAESEAPHRAGADAARVCAALVKVLGRTPGSPEI